MDNEAREILKGIIRIYGSNLINERQLLSALLHDLAPEHRDEASLLLAALDLGVAKRLLLNAQAKESQTPIKVLMSQLRQELSLYFKDDAVEWIIISWALALSVISTSEIVRFERKHTIPDGRQPVSGETGSTTTSSQLEEPLSEAHELFVAGRKRHQVEFEVKLHRILNELPCRTDDLSHSHVMLFHGEVGVGKSHLYTHLQQVAETKQPYFAGNCTCIPINWESYADMRDRKPESRQNSKNIMLRPVLDRIVEELGKRGLGGFRTYNQRRRELYQLERRLEDRMKGIKREARKMKPDLGHAIEEFDRGFRKAVGGTELVTSEEGLGTETKISLLVKVAVSSRELAEYLWEQALDALEDFQSRLSFEQTDLWERRNEKLAGAVSEGLRRHARYKPLLIFMDHYEMIDHLDTKLQSVMRESGPCVLWVIFGRRDLMEEHDGYAGGYARHMPPERLISLEVTPFQIADLEAYFSSYPLNISLTRDEVKSVHATTKGLPLAFTFVADKYFSQGTSADEITDKVPEREPRRALVKHVSEHLLRQLDTHDEEQVFIISIAYDARDVELLAEMTTIDEIGLEIKRLERLYGFALAAEVDKLRTYLREFLRFENRFSIRLRQANDRAVALIEERLADRESRCTTLHEQMKDDASLGTMRALTYHRFWEGHVAGWNTLFAALLPSLAYRPKYAEGLLSDTRQFMVRVSSRYGDVTDLGSLEYHQMVEAGVKALQGSIGDEESWNAAHRLLEEIKVKQPPADSHRQEREVILMWLEGRVAAYRDKTGARRAFIQAEEMCGQTLPQLRRKVSESRAALRKPRTP